MDREEQYIRIPREKLSFYHRINVGKDIRQLIKIVNYLQKWAIIEQKKEK